MRYSTKIRRWYYFSHLNNINIIKQYFLGSKSRVFFIHTNSLQVPWLRLTEMAKSILYVLIFKSFVSDVSNMNILFSQSVIGPFCYTFYFIIKYPNKLSSTMNLLNIDSHCSAGKESRLNGFQHRLASIN